MEGWQLFISREWNIFVSEGTITEFDESGSDDDNASDDGGDKCGGGDENGRGDGGVGDGLSGESDFEDSAEESDFNSEEEDDLDDDDDEEDDEDDDEDDEDDDDDHDMDLEGLSTHHQPKFMACEEDDDFLSTFDKMVNENINESRGSSAVPRAQQKSMAVPVVARAKSKHNRRCMFALICLQRRT